LMSMQSKNADYTDSNVPVAVHDVGFQSSFASLQSIIDLKSRFPH
jgi:hypothetical protein